MSVGALVQDRLQIRWLHMKAPQPQQCRQNRTVQPKIQIFQGWGKSCWGWNGVGAGVTGRCYGASPPSRGMEDEMVFKPPLPNPVRTALCSVEWQPGFKVFVEFSHRFYRDMSVPFSLWHQLFGTVNGAEIYFDAMFGKATDRHVMGVLVVGGVAAPSLEGVYTNSPSDQEIIFGVC